MARATKTECRGIPSWFLKSLTVGARIECEEIKEDSHIRKGDRGTVCVNNMTGVVMVAWDGKGLFPIKMGRDLYWVLNTVTTICYGEKRVWDSRQEAMDYFLEGVMACDGSERDRYASIYSQLASGANYATDD